MGSVLTALDFGQGDRELLICQSACGKGAKNRGVNRFTSVHDVAWPPETTWSDATKTIGMGGLNLQKG